MAVDKIFFARRDATLTS